MKRKSTFSGLVAAALIGLALPAMAETVLIDFDTLASNSRVNAYYNGGTDSFGLTGANFGVEFIDFVTANSSSAPSQPRYAYSASGNSRINVAAGFTAFDFAYGSMAPATLSVYSGLDGSGMLLGSQTLDSSGAVFGHSLVGFAGVGKSVTLSSLPSYAGLDNVRFTLAQPVPEASGWAMLLAGFGVLGALHRRRASLFE
jgi:hypothetical protein